MGFWERTWQEREQEVRRRFGPTEPPETVIPFSWDDIRLPGACALVFPPARETDDPRGAWQRRDDWLYVTLGLTQPLDQEQVNRERKAGSEYSSYGFELGILTGEYATWPANTLYAFTSHVTDGVQLKWGDRFGFGAYRQEDETIGVFTGSADKLGIEPLGEIRAMLFWPYMLRNSSFVTSTGKSLIYIATGITEEEWTLAKATTTAHVLLLLCRAGVGQRTDLERHSVLHERDGEKSGNELQR